MRAVMVIQNTDYEAAVRASFGRQKFMTTLGARLVHTVGVDAHSAEIVTEARF